MACNSVMERGPPGAHLKRVAQSGLQVVRGHVCAPPRAGGVLPLPGRCLCAQAGPYQRGSEPKCRPLPEGQGAQVQAPPKGARSPSAGPSQRVKEPESCVVVLNGMRPCVPGAPRWPAVRWLRQLQGEPRASAHTTAAHACTRTRTHAHTLCAHAHSTPCVTKGKGGQVTHGACLRRRTACETGGGTRQMAPCLHAPAVAWRLASPGGGRGCGTARSAFQLCCRRCPVRTWARAGCCQ